MESEVQSLQAMDKALGSVSKYWGRDSPKFDIVKFIILFWKDRWLSNTSFFIFHQTQLLGTRLFMAALFWGGKWDGVEAKVGSSPNVYQQKR